MNHLDLRTNFRYKADRKFLYDQYFVMKKRNGVYKGDCDDYAMTYAWILCGCNLWNFIKAIFLKSSIRFYRVKTITGGNHLVGCVWDKDEWFDNWTLVQKSRNQFFAYTRHTLKKRLNRFHLAIFLFVGLFFKR